MHRARSGVDLQTLDFASIPEKLWLRMRIFERRRFGDTSARFLSGPGRRSLANIH